MQSPFLLHCPFHSTDDFYTRLVDLERLNLKSYIKKDSLIACPCDSSSSAFVTYLKKYNFNFINFSDMFNKSLYKGCSFVVTNPPYSKLREFILFLNSLHLRFILVVPFNCLFISFYSKYHILGVLDTFITPDGFAAKSPSCLISNF